MRGCLWKRLSHWLMGFTGITLLLLVIVAPVLLLLLRKYFRKRREATSSQHVTVAFFHPYCNTGGGGERVLWCAVKALNTRFPSVRMVIYTGDLDVSPEDILKRVHQRFNVELHTDQVGFVYLRWRRLLEADRYPLFTILGQSIGSFLLGLEAILTYVPDIYIDTTGHAFTYPLFRYVGGCRVGCYTHYPVITSDMLRRVSTRTVAYNNRRIVARSPFLTAGKLLYYKLFAWVYGAAGRSAEIVMVNSSWTEEHINELWQCPLRTHRVYPPCDVEDLKNIPIDNDRDAGIPSSLDGSGDTVSISGADKKVVKIVSVAQYRPEKDHPLQLRSMYQLRQYVPEDVWDSLRLIFVGSCRNAEDDVRVQDMKDLCKHLSLENNVEFKVNVPYEELRRELEEGSIGLHAMWNEHFGIGVVECMAAGLIMVAHRSGGPQMDIVEEAEGSRNGFLAADEQEYASAIAHILRMSPEARKSIREAARSSVERFSVQEFNKGFLRAVEPLFSQR
ncbi:GDP-Man:Man(3)GlcNAc(2)-PP-Dol alpha-1,2-mannosyltransferase [Schistocerca serialis cubense]|uniref:GDP-Man:Man(3)GlcNAc(2)-PP-Dol alpha-1,2-mannosyltransferase n=1 Tax=Schistocerca serialis cubense TaxID=2023355 RepID=UPI00214EEB16|nr:GDP-Man:Man(3)GlcNAc(2)-PP-Dol alpha-1,2-mannosyltransferase [Schistocerca serialis cubense]